MRPGTVPHAVGALLRVHHQWSSCGPEDAAEAAHELVNVGALEFTDAVLQTLVQQGWGEQALPLYRTMFSEDPRNQLLRRRLVALCIKQGKITEARAFAEPGALDLSAGHYKLSG